MEAVDLASAEVWDAVPVLDAEWDAVPVPDRDTRQGNMVMMIGMTLITKCFSSCYRTMRRLIEPSKSFRVVSRR